MNELVKKIIEFRNERGWETNDSYENLAKSIMIEAAELLENFQWGNNHYDIENVREEIADVLIYTIALAHDFGFDIKDIINEKLNKNAVKYPIEKKE